MFRVITDIPLGNRIMIVGCSGSGKTTLASRIAAQTGLPHISLDAHYFGPDWKEPKQQDWAATVSKLAAADRWVMDGNYSGTFPLRLPRADTLIFMDQPAWRCLYRVIKRTIQYWGRVRPGSAPGCRERFSSYFLKYVAGYNTTRRPGILKTMAEQRTLGKQVYILRAGRLRALP